MKKLLNIWKKIEVPVVIVIIILSLLVAFFAITSFDTKAISAKQLAKFYQFNYNGMEFFGFVIVLTRNLILWMAINLFNNNIVLSAVLAIAIPRLLSLPFLNK